MLIRKIQQIWKQACRIRQLPLISTQVELTDRLVEKSNLVGCRTEANLDVSGFGGVSTREMGDVSSKSQSKEHGPKRGDVIKVAGIGLTNNDDVDLVVNRAADEDTNNLSLGGDVMAQEVLVDNLVSLRSKAIEREELSGRITPVLEHREMDHVTLDLPEF
ncbi:hypothetical protein V6N12_023491 [Hibiscus sabdariffa]|uniref:Uncharacterized protein n=1 Tax=Hibiscus sabdariffa TaxID=183260 RepID=A0ABR2FXV3_9ROSI